MVYKVKSKSAYPYTFYDWKYLYFFVILYIGSKERQETKSNKKEL